MLKPKTKRTVSLAIALVFLFTVIAPMGAFAADNDYTKYRSTYTYVTADDDVDAGTATVEYDGDFSVAGVTYIQAKLTLPDGVEFSKTPKAENVAANKFAEVNTSGLKPLGSGNYFVKANSSSITLKGEYISDTAWKNFSVNFNFEDQLMPLDIDSDFTGNVDATIEVWGLKGDSIAWTESDDVTIAKVAGSEDVMVSAKSPKIVSKGSGKKGAEIKVYETKPGSLNNKEQEYVVYDILTSGVTFDESTIKDKDSIQAVSFKSGVNDLDYDDDHEQVTLKVNEKSSIFPGDIVFTPYFKVDPKVTGDVKIRVSSEDKDGHSTNTISKTTVTVATVGDAKAKIDKLEDNDTVAYSGQITELDVSMKIETEDGNDFKDGDMMTFELNKGKFVKTDELNIDNNNCEIELYDSEKAFYVSFNDKAGSDFTVDNFYIQLDNDTEPGDITLTISGDYGDLDEATIGVAAAPFTLKADKNPIMTEALNQAAGDITVNEAADGALQEGSVLVFEIPSGIELNGKPKLDVVSGNFDGDITVIDDSMIALEVTDESSDPSEFKITNINYDTGRLALNGDVEVKAYIIDPDVLINESDDNTYKVPTSISDKIDDYDDTGVIATVANATCGSDDLVTATFKVGDEGVAVINGRTLVQVNTLCDVLGLQKSWDEATKTAYFVQNGKVVAFPMGENAVYINGTKIAVDQGGKIIDNYTYASLRGIQMAFGGELEWDDATKTATFNFNK
ncbi:copper amine oxidase N-terminal domain-containing protein [Desulfoscipio sp. XC116]|uniref:copper amine oxidase N-terminal domain-containing protein n=1 Tax=Desulfoscipio sp. XC116 TaxID=3144975 RepID=UPI00325C1EB0